MYSEYLQATQTLATIMQTQLPSAHAFLRGDQAHAQLTGSISFYPLEESVLVITEVCHLPHGAGACSSRMFALHIHEGNSCTGTQEDPFASVGDHYNPAKCPHPHHAGDLPPLFENAGYAWSAFVTNRFTIHEIIGRTVIIHSNPDDFTSQPSGNAGNKIACGVIQRV